MAKVLVGIPTRNRPQMVREAVLSVLNQTEPDFRLIVSENPTTPEASADLRQWIESLGDPRVSYVLQAIDGGEYGQGRYLFGQCQEPYFCHLHDDDLMSPTFLAQALAALEAHPQCCLFSSSQYIIDVQGRSDPQHSDAYATMLGRDRHAAGPMVHALDALLETGLFSITGVVMRRSAVEVRGLVDEDMGGLFPFEFNVFLRLLEGGATAYYTPDRLIAYRWHNSSMRHTDGATLTRFMVEPLIELLQRRRFSGRTERLRRRLLSYNQRNLAVIELVSGQRRAALRQIVHALRSNPWGRSIWAYGAAILLVPAQMAARFRSRVNLAAPSPSWALAIPGAASRDPAQARPAAPASTSV